MIPTVDLNISTNSGEDFKALGEHSLQPDVLRRIREQYQDKAEELVQVFGTVGFAYITNHGIPEHMVEDMFSKSRQFFSLPSEEKNKLVVPAQPNSPCVGYVPPGREVFDASRPADVKEAFDCVCDDKTNSKIWPSDELCKGFQATVTTMNQHLRILSNKILRLIGIGLHLQDPDFFVKSVADASSNILRLLCYPQISSLSGLKAGQMRCSEHTDYGNITLLFQDDCGGLEVQNTEGEYISATPKHGTVLVNIADFMQMCTGNRLKSTLHRVLIPESNFSRARYSLAFFCDPDGEKLTMPLFGEKNFQPVSFNQWRYRRFVETGLADANKNQTEDYISSVKAGYTPLEY